MKYYFSLECYFDMELGKAFRNGNEVNLTQTQKNILSCLLKNNRKMVSHDNLYSAAFKDKDARFKERDISTRKQQISTQFTSKDGLEKRIPEIKEKINKSRDQIHGGYMITIPDEFILDESRKVNTTLSGNTWLTNEDINAFIMDCLDISEGKQSKDMRSFLHGRRCTWPIICHAGNTPVRRDVIDVIKECINNESCSVVLTGAGAEGKSTALMQLCIELHKEGRKILFHNTESGNYDIPNVSADTIILIDSPGVHNKFRDFLSAATASGLTVVFTLRSNEWNILYNKLPDDTSRSIEEISMPAISINEAKEFSACILRNIDSVSKTEDELREVFVRTSNGFLYASMLMVIYNCDSLERLALQILGKIYNTDESRPCLGVLASVVFAEKSKIRVDMGLYREICKQNDVNENEPDKYLEMELTRNHREYQTRHEIISELFYKYLFQDGNWEKYITMSKAEDIATDILDFYLRRVSRAQEDLPQWDYRGSNAARAAICILRTFCDDDEYIDWIIQRVFESCNKHGYTVIQTVYHQMNDKPDIRYTIAMKCYEGRLGVWEIYTHWLREEIANTDKESARTIYKNIIEMQDCPVNLWVPWAEFEEHNGNIGNYNLDGTAAWIIKTACVEKNEKGFDMPWRRWVDFVRKHPNISDEYTDTTILRMACMEYSVMDSSFWLLWGDSEAMLGNIGSGLDEGSAVWIYKTALERQDESRKSWRKLSDFIELYYSQIQHSDIENAIKTLESACYGVDKKKTNAWLALAKLKELVGEIGDYSTKETAAWIYKEFCLIRNKTSIRGILAWAKFANRHPMHDEDRYIDAFYLLDYVEREYEFISDPDRLELEEFKKSIGYGQE